MSQAPKLGVALFGVNGHQIHHALVNHPEARVVAVAGFQHAGLPAALANVPRVATLQDLLANEHVQVVVLCSPRRAEQAYDAVTCLKAGRHVLADRPSALNEADLDAILETTRLTRCHYHEMAGTVVEQPYMEMRRQIHSGAIGAVVQVSAQRSQAWTEQRPAHEDQDGGLALQNGVIIARYVEHIAGVPISAIGMLETRLGNPSADSECRTAVSFFMRLQNGGVASGICNYLNPMSRIVRSYDELRIFGTHGIIEYVSDGKRCRLIQHGKPPRDILPPRPSIEYDDLFFRHLRRGDPMPLTVEDELSPTRWALRAKASASPSHA